MVIIFQTNYKMKTKHLKNSVKIILLSKGLEGRTQLLQAENPMGMSDKWGNRIDKNLR